MLNRFSKIYFRQNPFFIKYEPKIILMNPFYNIRILHNYPCVEKMFWSAKFALSSISQIALRNISVSSILSPRISKILNTVILHIE